MAEINILVVGDVCANIGVRTVQELLPQLIRKYDIFFSVLNAENALNGEGLDEALASSFFHAGVDVITGGNHSLQDFSLRERFLQVKNVLRPANISDVGGSGFVRLNKGNFTFEVANFLGRENMRLADSPFALADELFSTELDCFRIVDFHAESSEEKEAFGFYLDGRVSLVFGTHTHVQTADEKILPNGTAYISDVGFVGAENSVIGTRPEYALERQQNFFSREKRWFDSGAAILSGIVVKLNCESKKATSIRRILERINISS